MCTEGIENSKGTINGGFKMKLYLLALSLPAPPPSTHLSRTLSILGGNGGQESDKKAFYISNRVYWCE